MKIGAKRYLFVCYCKSKQS